MNGHSLPTFSEVVAMLSPVMANPPEVYEWNGKWYVSIVFDDKAFDTKELAEQYAEAYNAFLNDYDGWNATPTEH